MRRLFLLLCTVSLAAACSEPPHKELDRAQGALDAARAAGAEQYAAESFAAATGALAEAHEAVHQRDYRLALSLAVDASERAQGAAKEAAEVRATILGERERAIASTTSALKELHSQIAAAQAARVPTPELEAAEAVANDTAAALQEARTLLGQEDYAGAGKRLEGRPDEIREQIALLEEAVKARGASPVRRRR
jgi:hypothetical protein